MSASAILLVEDSVEDRDLTVRALSRVTSTNRIDVAEDGEEAVQYLEDPERAAPVLVLLDLKLPKMMGHEVLRRMRSNARMRLVPAVILSGSKEERDVSAAYLTGANAYVQKPTGSSDFTEAIRTIGRFWLGLNEIPRARPHV